MITGQLKSTEASSGIIAVVLSLLFLSLLKLLWSVVNRWSLINKVDMVIRNHQRELLNLGLLGFLLFLFNPAEYESTQRAENLSQAYKFVNVFIIFIAVALVLQTCYLLNVSTSLNNRHFRCNSFPLFFL